MGVVLCRAAYLGPLANRCVWLFACSLAFLATQATCGANSFAINYVLLSLTKHNAAPNNCNGVQLPGTHSLWLLQLGGVSPNKLHA